MLFAFLSISNDKQVICAVDNGAIFRQPRDREGLAPCSHEEADNGMMQPLRISQWLSRKLQVHETCTDLHGPVQMRRLLLVLG